ncbi:hypothetical protein AFM11_11795 [Mycolicibacterium wolinskyi]|uniref:Small hydrophilic protein n=1 Tax=Mycolicibacterium wolinskyi TaxID=59750 RepID=A0A132PNY1_9MYCO|nr:hypothetical protein [Mycolicibacterium wolinskyi]KWX24041.1 hypothetical protein AFM11_11795 [Mycolicibacterium wolinskyi]
MRTTILIPIAALVIAGAATAVGVSMTSSADEPPIGPIVVHAPQRPATAQSVAPPPESSGVPAPPPPVTHGGLPASGSWGGGDDDDWGDDGDDDDGDD